MTFSMGPLYTSELFSMLSQRCPFVPSLQESESGGRKALKRKHNTDEYLSIAADYYTPLNTKPTNFGFGSAADKAAATTAAPTTSEHLKTSYPIEGKDIRLVLDYLIYDTPNHPLYIRNIDYILDSLLPMTKIREALISPFNEFTARLGLNDGANQEKIEQVLSSLKEQCLHRISAEMKPATRELVSNYKVGETTFGRFNNSQVPRSFYSASRTATFAQNPFHMQSGFGLDHRIATPNFPTIGQPAPRSELALRHLSLEAQVKQEDSLGAEDGALLDDEIPPVLAQSSPPKPKKSGFTKVTNPGNAVLLELPPALLQGTNDNTSLTSRGIQAAIQGMYPMSSKFFEDIKFFSVPGRWVVKFKSKEIAETNFLGKHVNLAGHMIQLQLYRPKWAQVFICAEIPSSVDLKRLSKDLVAILKGHTIYVASNKGQMTGNSYTAVVILERAADISSIRFNIENVAAVSIQRTFWHVKFDVWQELSGCPVCSALHPVYACPTLTNVISEGVFLPELLAAPPAVV